MTTYKSMLSLTSHDNLLPRPLWTEIFMLSWKTCPVEILPPSHASSPPATSVAHNFYWYCWWH